MCRLSLKFVVIPSIFGLLLAGCGGGSSAVPGDTRPAAVNSQSEKQASTLGTKQHPGYYVVLNSSNTPSQLSQLLGQRGVQGLVKQYAWRDIETSMGNYDFSQLRADLAIVSNQKKYFIAQFDLVPNGTEQRLPDYLRQDYVLPAQIGAPVLKIWDMYVIDRLTTLFAELSAHVDHDPYFEGIVIKTPDIQLNEQSKAKYAYSEETHRTALIHLLTQTKTAFSSSQVFWSVAAVTPTTKLNQDIATAASATGVIVGGAELLPDHPQWASAFAPFYKAFKDRNLLFAVVGQASYAHAANTEAKTKYWTMSALADYAKQKLATRYLFWEQKAQRDPTDSYQWSDVIPVLEAVPPRY
jgi:hypothetical protein